MLRGKMPHFRLTSVVQKRLCLSSLFSVVQATEALSFLFSFRGWRKDGRLVIFNLISLLRIGNDGLQWRGYVLGEAGEGGFVCCLTLNFKPLRLAYWGWSKGDPCPSQCRYLKNSICCFLRHRWSFSSFGQSCLAIINLPRVADLRLCRLLEFAIMGSYPWGFLFEKTETLVES